MPPVRDVDGDILKSDAKYNMESANGDSVTRADHNVVVKSPSISVNFKPKVEVEIPESTDLNIKFNLDNNNVWMVEDSGYVSTNGKAGDPSNVFSWFQIKKVNDLVYKLVSCPSGEKDIGIKVVDGQRRLAIGTDNTFNVVFKKDP